MAAGSIAAGWLARRYGARAIVLAAAAIVFLLVVIVGGLSGGQSTTESSAPSAVRRRGHPERLPRPLRAGGGSVRDRLGGARRDRKGRMRPRTQPGGGMQPARNRERGRRHGPDAVHRFHLVSGYSADERPGDRPTDDLYKRRVRDRRGRRRAGERLGSGRRDCRRGAPAARERGTGRLPEGDLCLQPRRRVCPGGSRAGERVPRRFRARSVSWDSRRPRLGGRTCRAVHLQPRTADRPRRIGGGHAEQGARRARPATARCSPAGRSRRRASTSG